MDDTAKIDRRETVFSLEPLLPGEGGPHWLPLAERAEHLLAASEALRSRVQGLETAERKSLAGQVFVREVTASWALEGERSREQDVKAAREALKILEAGPWLSPDCVEAAHAVLFPENAGLRKVDVSVGSHLPPSPGSLSRLLRHLEAGYSRPGRIGKLLSIAAGHHRLSWVHPFRDGNGRIARLTSRQRLRKTLPGSEFWSLSEGLLRRQGDYLRVMALADETRRGDRDGRGSLSEARLASLISFFFDVMEERIAKAQARPE